MEIQLVLCCLLATTVLGKGSQKISLEDIERDNLKSEKRTIPQAPKEPSPGAPTNFGFLPVKTANDYARQEPKTLYLQPQYIPQAQHQIPYQTQQQQYIPITQQQQYYYQPQPASQQSQYQQYENVQYITDNNIAQHQQQYYQPQQQYVYLQQYTAPSTAIQTVVDPKGAVQYVMYVPSYVSKEQEVQPEQTITKNVGSIIYADKARSNAQVSYAPQYVPTPQPQATVQYNVEDVKPDYFGGGHREPKSLLDSYVPSILQVQYYKQQQARINDLFQKSQQVKLSGPVDGKSDYVKYRPVGSESTLRYSYHPPSSYLPS